MIDALASAVVEVLFEGDAASIARPVREATAFGGDAFHGNGVLERARHCSVQGIPLAQHST